MPRTLVVDVRHDRYDVYIGRAGRSQSHALGRDGYYGNPFRVTDHGGVRCLTEFRAYFDQRVAEDQEYRERILALRGRVLGCFCAPPGGLTAGDEHICHGQIIAEWLDNQP